MPDYVRPTSISEAIDVLAAAAGGMPLAGGTDLMNDMRLGRISPSVVVDIGALPLLGELTVTETVSLGAGVTVRTLLSAAGLHRRLGALHDAARLLGGPQIQAVATLGGNLCKASPAAETATPMLVHDAVAHLVGPTGTRELPMYRFWASPGRTALDVGELLTRLTIGPGPADWVSAYRRLELRRSVDIAVVSASASLDIADGSVIRQARVAIGAVAPVPLRVPAAEEVLVGVRVDLGLDSQPQGAFARAIADAGRRCQEAARPIADVRASAEYRATMVGVVVSRALTAAASRLGRHAVNS